MTDWIKRIHMYTGLLNVTALAVFGVIGIAATVLPSPHPTGLCIETATATCTSGSLYRLVATTSPSSRWSIGYGSGCNPSTTGNTYFICTS